MDDFDSTRGTPSLRTQSNGFSAGSRWIKLLGYPIFVATLTATSPACPPWSSRSHCKHNIGQPCSNTQVQACRPIGTWTMVQGPNSFPSCGPCGCGDWQQSDWPSPDAIDPPRTAEPPATATNPSTSPLAPSLPPKDTATESKLPAADQSIDQDQSATDQPNWRPPTGQSPASQLPMPNVPTSDPLTPKAQTVPSSKEEKDPAKELELLFGDPPAETPTGDQPQSRWLPRTGVPQGIDRTSRFANARLPNAPSYPGQQDWRIWTDHTGNFRVRARLIEVGAHHLVLLKENGLTTTLPISRLSPEDAVYLRLGK